jgi:hypothetical protein
MRRIILPPLDFDDVARIQWENCVESKVNHFYDPPAKPSRRRRRPGEEPSRYHQDALLLYRKTHGR